MTVTKHKMEMALYMKACFRSKAQLSAFSKRSNKQIQPLPARHSSQKTRTSASSQRLLKVSSNNFVVVVFNLTVLSAVNTKPTLFPQISYNSVHTTLNILGESILL